MSLVDCPPRDEDYCGEPQPYGYEKENCEWTNVPEECPFMCEFCTGPQGKDNKSSETFKFRRLENKVFYCCCLFKKLLCFSF